MKTSETEMKGGNSVKHTGTNQRNDIKTDSLLSEKDEVKKAETRTRKALKDHL